MSDDISRRCQEFFNRRAAVSILDGRFKGRSGTLVERDGDMCVVEVDDEHVRISSANVYKVLT